MKDYISTFEELLLEEKGDPFREFAQGRHDGAKKIADTAKEKSGNSMLTYHHFVVKLPYYKRAAAGKFDPAGAQREHRTLTRKLGALLKSIQPADQIPFQKLMGQLEVLGELIIAHSKWHA